jgi:hypothetical protein
MEHGLMWPIKTISVQNSSEIPNDYGAGCWDHWCDAMVCSGAIQPLNHGPSGVAMAAVVTDCRNSLWPGAGVVIFVVSTF